MILMNFECFNFILSKIYSIIILRCDKNNLSDCYVLEGVKSV